MILYFARTRNVDACLKLLEDNPNLAKARDNSGRTPLVCYLRALSLAGYYNEKTEPKPTLNINVDFIQKLIALYPEALFLLDKEGNSAMRYTFSKRTIQIFARKVLRYEYQWTGFGWTRDFKYIPAYGDEFVEQDKDTFYLLPECFHTLLRAGGGFIIGGERITEHGVVHDFLYFFNDLIKEQKFPDELKHKYVLFMLDGSYDSCSQLRKKLENDGYKLISSLEDLQSYKNQMTIYDMRRLLSHLKIFFERDEQHNGYGF